MLYKLTINSKSIFYLYNIIIWYNILFFDNFFNRSSFTSLRSIFFFNKYIYFTYFSFSFFFFEKKTSDKSFVILSKIYTFSIFHDVYIYIYIQIYWIVLNECKYTRENVSSTSIIGSAESNYPVLQPFGTLKATRDCLPIKY